MIRASDKGDVEFINKVIVPILHAEEKVPISLSVWNKSKKFNEIEPIYQSTETSTAKADSSRFILKTDILNSKQKQKFTKMFQELSADKVDNFDKLQDSKWDLIYEEKQVG